MLAEIQWFWSLLLTSMHSFLKYSFTTLKSNIRGFRSKFDGDLLLARAVGLSRSAVVRHLLFSIITPGCFLLLLLSFGCCYAFFTPAPSSMVLCPLSIVWYHYIFGFRKHLNRHKNLRRRVLPRARALRHERAIQLLLWRTPGGGHCFFSMLFMGSAQSLHSDGRPRIPT